MTSYISKRYHNRCKLGLIDNVLAWPHYGYFGGGGVTTDRINFSSGVTVVNTISNLTSSRSYLAGFSDKIIQGYFTGGAEGDFVPVTKVDCIVFSTGITALNTISNLSLGRYGLTSLSDAVNYGYTSGGITGTNWASIVTTDRTTFSSGITSVNTVSNLSQARNMLASLSDSITYGYFSGGHTYSQPSPVVTTDRIVFSSGVTSANGSSNLSQARGSLTGISDNLNYGYFCGGLTVTGNTAITDRITFSSGITAANTVSNLSTSNSNMTTSSDGILYGYIVGGLQADRIIFSTGVTSSNTVSKLSTNRSTLAGLSDYAV